MARYRCEPVERSINAIKNDKKVGGWFMTGEENQRKTKGFWLNDKRSILYWVTFRSLLLRKAYSFGLFYRSL